MKSFHFDNSRIYYKNIGQQAEASIRYMFGYNPKADNRKAGADIIIDGHAYQIKSLRATVCRGNSLDNIRAEYFEAEGFIFAEPVESIAYIMTVDEFIEFVERFAEVDIESDTKATKMRLNRKYKAQRTWLQARA